MREASRLERSQKNLLPKAKFYIIPEGEKTEVQYFQGIKENRVELNINKLIEIIILENDETEQGHSHPVKKIENFNNDINKEKYIYHKDLDKVCFVIDRDPQNFKEKQFEDFVNQCYESNYEIYLTNPTFEFFLILHSDDVFEYDKKKMYENIKVSKSSRYLEKVLVEIFGCKKTNINFEKFKSNIGTAIKNEKKFANTVEELKENLGSNVGTLIEKMME